MSIEDPFDQDDWEHYAKLTAEVGTNVQIVGDDLLVTNPKVCCLMEQNFPLPLKKMFLFCWRAQKDFPLTFFFLNCVNRGFRKQSIQKHAMLFSSRYSYSIHKISCENFFVLSRCIYAP